MTNTRDPRNHELFFYDNEDAFVNSVASFASSALAAGHAAVVVATKPHRDSISDALRRKNIDVEAALRQGTYVSLDAAEALSTFMVNGWPDPARFLQGFCKVIESASRAATAVNPRVAIFGEAVTLLCDQGDTGAAVRLEQLGNDLAGRFDVDILCAYPLSLCTEQREYAIKQICAEHSAVHCAPASAD